jgi:TetR/AcrR family transcriptional regulator
MARPRTGERRQAILEALARMLAERHGERITTAELARAVGVSEAALYRHFPSKARMFEGLLDFIEETLFTRINRILAEEHRTAARVGQILYLILAFAEKNPGMARLLYGDVLTGETERLRRRVAQIHDRIETQLRQVLREGELKEGAAGLPVNGRVEVLMAVLDGKISRFVRSDFRHSPLEGWDRQWHMLEAACFAPRA